MGLTTVQRYCAACDYAHCVTVITASDATCHHDSVLSSVWSRYTGMTILGL